MMGIARGVTLELKRVVATKCVIDVLQAMKCIIILISLYGLKSNEAVKQTDCYNCFKYWQMLHLVILHLRCHTLSVQAGHIACYNISAQNEEGLAK